MLGAAVSSSSQGHQRLGRGIVSDVALRHAIARLGGFERTRLLDQQLGQLTPGRLQSPMSWRHRAEARSAVTDGMAVDVMVGVAVGRTVAVVVG